MPQFIQVKETESTNSYLKKVASMLPNNSVIYTHKQTQGRGQRGNVWESEDGKNVTFSMLIKGLNLKANKQFLMLEVVSIAVVEALNGFVEGFQIKWPNDIYWGDKKICGILIEHSLQNAMIYNSIVGVGINVNQRVFAEAPNPISLFNIVGKEMVLEDVMQSVCQKITYGMKFELEAKIHNKYLSLLYRRDGKFHQFLLPDGKCFCARIDNVDVDGTLWLENESDGEKCGYLFKEVSFVI